MKYFKLPDLGEGLQEAEIIEWLVKPGDQVKSDQIEGDQRLAVHGFLIEVVLKLVAQVELGIGPSC